MSVMLDVPADAPTPFEGYEWRQAALIREGDLIFVGKHNVFGEREPFFHRVERIEEKPKTFSVTLVPTHPRMFGSERRRFHKDDWLLVKVVT